MARTANKLTLIRFANGRELVVKPSPDEVAKAIDDYDGGLTRVLDVRGNAAWINPRDVVTITSHRPRKRRQAADDDIDAELATLGRAVPRHRDGT